MSLTLLLRSITSSSMEMSLCMSCNDVMTLNHSNMTIWQYCNIAIWRYDDKRRPEPASPHRRSCYSSRSSWSSQWRGPTSRGPRQALLKSVDEGCWNMFSGYYDAEYIYSGYICNFIPKHILRFCTFLLAILDFYILQSFELQGWYHYWFHWCQCQELMPMHVLRTWDWWSIAQ